MKERAFPESGFGGAADGEQRKASRVPERKSAWKWALAVVCAPVVAIVRRLQLTSRLGLGRFYTKRRCKTVIVRPEPTFLLRHESGVSIDVARVSDRACINGRHPGRHGVAADNGVGNAGLIQNSRDSQQTFAHLGHSSLHAVENFPGHCDG